MMKAKDTQKSIRITNLYGFKGLEQVEIKEAQAGDIVAVTGIDDIHIGETICSKEHPEALPLLRIDEPTLQMTFLVNNSPFAGREGDYLTSRMIYDRLLRELETDVSLRVEQTESPDAWIVSVVEELILRI